MHPVLNEASVKPFWAEAASPVKRETAPGAVVQLVRIPACHAVGREFESRPHRKKSTAMWTFLCDGLKLREFLSLYVRTIIAQVQFSSLVRTAKPAKLRALLLLHIEKIVCKLRNQPKICSNCHLLRNTRRISFCSSVILCFREIAYF